MLHNCNIKPCRGCDSCRSGTCAINDDMDYILPYLEQAGALIIASPIYFYGLTSQVKALIDRCQVFWNRYYHHTQAQKNIPGQGALIAVGATRGEKLFTGAILTTSYFFKALNIEYKYELLVRGVEEFAAIREHPQELEAAYRLGQSLVTPTAP
ncbi:MAG: flavodoxin family protein [Clostridia bacterium]|nr:flavodoxin family protein [Clostridia bacterium]